MIKDKVGIIIQARTGSKRLPNKVMKPFWRGKSILELITLRLKKAYPSVPLIIATSKNSKDQIIYELAKQMGVSCYQGSEQNVLDRFTSAANLMDIHYGYRICADNPFLDVLTLKELQDTLSEDDYDYIGFRVNGKPSVKTHYGFWGELIKVSVLNEMNKKKVGEKYREHVTNYIYEHPQEFNIKWIDLKSCILKNNPIRLTLDTKKDFILQKKIYEEVITEDIPIDMKCLIDYIKDKPKYLHKMGKEISKNYK